MPMSPKERMQVYRKRLKGILPPSPQRLSAAKKVLKERQRAKLAALSIDETASVDVEEIGLEEGDREMKTRNDEPHSPKTPTTDRPFITVIKTNDSKVSESGSSEESEDESEPASKAGGSESNKYALPSPYKNLPSVSVCLKEEDRLLAQRELGRSLLRTSPSSSNGGSDVNKSPRGLKIATSVKKKRAEKPSPKVTGRKNDCYCWVCHRENISLVCIGCPRAFHHKCAGETAASPTNWVCPECSKILHAEAVDTQSSVLSEISLEKLCSLLKFSLYKMKQRGGAPFHQPVSFEHFPMYPHYVIHPMDFSLLEKNIKQKLYGSTEAFLSDVKWILHNSCVFNGAQHPLSNNAKSVVKNCENDMQEIEICPDCFMHGANRNNKYWFSEVCGKPHPLVWAKLKGFPYWPAKVVRIVDGNVDARFFGAHDRAWVPVNQCYHLSKETPTSSKPKKKGNYEVALAELNVHVHLLIQKFGTFEYAPYRQVFDPTNKKHMFHGIDIDKISKEEIPVESTSIVTSDMCTSPMDTGKGLESKTTQDSAEGLSKGSEPESGVASPEPQEMDDSVNMQRKSTVVDSPDSKEKSDSGCAPIGQEKASYDPSGLNKIQKVLEKIKGIVSVNEDDDEDEESEEAEKEESKSLQESAKEPKTTNSENNVSDDTNDNNLKNPEGSIIAGLMKSKPLPLLDIIAEDVPEEPPVSIMNTSNRNDLFSLKLNETIESCKAKLGISEVNDSMDIDSEEDEDDEEEDDDDDEDEEMEQDSEEDGAEKKEDSGSEQSGEDSSEESDADQSDSASSNTDIEEVSAFIKDSEKTGGHPVSEGSNDSNSSEKTSVKSKESPKEILERGISESKELNTGKSLNHQAEDGSSSGKQNDNKNCAEVQTDEGEEMSDNDSESASNASRTNIALPLDQEGNSESPADTKEQISGSANEEGGGKETPKGEESDDDIFICDPPPKPPTPPLICLDDGTDETEPEAEEKASTGKEEERRNTAAMELLQKEEELVRKQLAAAAAKPMPMNARKSIRRVVRPPPPPESSDEEEEAEVAQNRVPLTGAKRTFPIRSTAGPAVKRARAVENPTPSARVEAAQEEGDSDEGDDDEDVEMERGAMQRNTRSTASDSDQVATDLPNETRIPNDPDMLFKLKKRLMHVYGAYKLQRWKFMQEKAEMKHNMNLALMEMRSSLEAEKRHALDAQSQTLTLEKSKSVEEAKKKQWCACCLQESRYACCWNTSYCTIICQKKHFPVHRKTCTQLKLKNISNKGTEVSANEGKKLVLLNMVPKSDANQPTVQIPLAKVIAQKPTQLSPSVSSSPIQLITISPAQQPKPATLQNKIANSSEETETQLDDSSQTTECETDVPKEKRELSLEERYFPSPPTVSFEGLDSALPDESVCFDDLVQEASDDASDTEAKKGDSSPEEDFEFSDDEKSADNELVSLGYGLEVKAKFLNKCLIFGKTAKKLTRCLVDVIFPDTKLLANCSAYGNKSNLTKLTRAALPSRKVACIIDYVKKRFPDANKSEIVMAINLKCKEARAIVGKPVMRRLLAKEQEIEASAVSSKTAKSLPKVKTTIPSKMRRLLVNEQKIEASAVSSKTAKSLPTVKTTIPSKVIKPTATVSNTTVSTTTLPITSPITVLRQPPNIVCVQNPSNSTISPQQKSLRTGVMQLKLPGSTTAATFSRTPNILSKTVLKMPPHSRQETIRSILTRTQPQAKSDTARSILTRSQPPAGQILLPVHLLQRKGPVIQSASSIFHPKAPIGGTRKSIETTDSAQGQRRCIFLTEATSSTASTNSQKPCTSTTAKQN